jgi:hypothetical protein
MQHYWEHSMIRKCILIVALATLISAFTGCTNLKDVGTFADSAKALATSSDQLYEMTYRSDRQIAGFTAATTQPAVQDPFETAIGTQALLNESKRHRAAVGALTAYADALNNLATLNESTQIDASAKELSTSLLSFKDQLKGLNDIDSDQLTNAIEAVANIFIDVRKQIVIREKVKAAQPHVKNIVAIILKDVQRQEQRSGVELSSRKSARRIWFDGLISGYDTASASDKALRGMAAGDIIVAEIDDRKADLDNAAFLEQLTRAANSCVAAHDALSRSHGSKDAVIKFYNEIRSLVSALQHIQKK